MSGLMGTGIMGTPYLIQGINEGVPIIPVPIIPEMDGYA